MSKSKTKKKVQDHHGDIIVIKVKPGKLLEYRYDSDDSEAKSHETHGDGYVRWRCKAGNYTIVFGQHTPFANPCYSKKKGDDLILPLQSNSGTYKYSVVVETSENNHAVGDPQIVIN